jgi:aminobenzoyl-glutamate utilization protein A
MDKLQQWMTTIRRDLHRYAEAGWFEFRTSSVIAAHLEKLGYQVFVGSQIINEDAVMGRDGKAVPAQKQRAIRQGAQKDWIDRMGDYTGVLGILDTGKPGPVVTLRFDIDAVEMNEAEDENHRPFREGFSSLNAGAMHSCGHDGHTAMGLGLARILAGKKSGMSGRVNLVFQPAEEGARGAKAIVEKGLLDDTDYFVGLHLGLGNPTGMVVAGASGFLCTTKFDVRFRGRSSHAGVAPHEGRNALLAAATAALNLHAIAPHGEGTSRVNVGVLEAGEGRNVIPPVAFMKAETRGETDEIDAYMFDRASKIVSASAAMYEVDCDVSMQGRGIAAESDEEMIDLVIKAASDVEACTETRRHGRLGGSEDATWMMKRVQEKGGKATYILLGSDIAAGHHNQYFDFDETCLSTGVEVLTNLIEKLLAEDI